MISGNGRPGRRGGGTGGRGDERGRIHEVAGLLLGRVLEAGGRRPVEGSGEALRLPVARACRRDRARSSSDRSTA